MTTADTRQSWFSAWPDALAFVLGLSVARIAGWTTTDLVWSLWLSSFVVGYAMIVWTIVRPGIDLARAASREPGLTGQIRHHKGAAVAGASVLIVGGLFMLAFFTVHFGGFHYVHSQFLYSFFPLDGVDAGRVGTAGTATYLDVAQRYWHFLPAAFLAERAGFARQSPLWSTDDLSVTPAAIAARKAANAKKGAVMMAPYRNVLRMHGLIFFFAFAHFADVDGFLVYAVVYAVYFFPWRLVRKGAPGAQSAQGKTLEARAP